TTRTKTEERASRSRRLQEPARIANGRINSPDPRSSAALRPNRVDSGPAATASSSPVAPESTASANSALRSRDDGAVNLVIRRLGVFDMILSPDDDVPLHGLVSASGSRLRGR